MNEHEVIITTRDKLMRSWQNSMELVRDYESFSKEEEGVVRAIFKDFAEEEGMHASKLRELLLKDQNNNNIPGHRRMT